MSEDNPPYMSVVYRVDDDTLGGYYEVRAWEGHPDTVEVVYVGPDGEESTDGGLSMGFDVASRVIQAIKLYKIHVRREEEMNEE